MANSALHPSLLDRVHITSSLGRFLDAIEVPYTYCILAGSAWHACRRSAFSDRTTVRSIQLHLATHRAVVAQKRWQLPRDRIARSCLYMSHETFTCLNGGCAQVCVM
jgi:hypothetical protein